MLKSHVVMREVEDGTASVYILYDLEGVPQKTPSDLLAVQAKSSATCRDFSR